MVAVRDLARVGSAGLLTLMAIPATAGGALASTPRAAAGRTALAARTAARADEATLGARHAEAVSRGEASAVSRRVAASRGPTLALSIGRAHGRPALAVAGETVVVAGKLTPYVRGQKVRVALFLRGRRVAARTLALRRGRDGRGRFRLRYASSAAGVLEVRARRRAGAPARALKASRLRLRFLPATLAAGSRGPVVRLLQRELASLHYAVPQSGIYDEGTDQAVIAYRKMNGLTRESTTEARIFGLLQRRAGAFVVRYPGDGRHVEADLSRQVLAEIEQGGRVRQIYTISSGKPSTPTVLGRFRVYLKTPGVNSEGMVDSNYFIRGYAIHGYAEVPTYPASHGCLRLPIPDAPAVYAWLRVGTPVDVYT